MKKMRKRLFAACLMAASTFSLGGNAGAAEKQELMMGTATTGGFTYIWGAAAAQIINKYVPSVNITAQITTGGNETLSASLPEKCQWALLEAILSNLSMMAFPELKLKLIKT